MGSSLTFAKKSAVHVKKDSQNSLSGQNFCIIKISTVRFGKVNDPYLSKITATVQNYSHRPFKFKHMNDILHHMQFHNKCPVGKLIYYASNTSGLQNPFGSFLKQKENRPFRWANDKAACRSEADLVCKNI